MSASLHGLSTRYTAGVQMSADTTSSPPRWASDLRVKAACAQTSGLPARPFAIKARRNAEEADVCNSCYGRLLGFSSLPRVLVSTQQEGPRLPRQLLKVVFSL